MKNWLYLILLPFLLASCNGELFPPDEQYGSVRNKKIAILPFEVVTEITKMPEEVTLEMLKNEEYHQGYVMQLYAYKYFLRGQGQKQSTTQFQKIQYTNKLLKEHNLNFETIKKYPREKLASLLGVDGILSGNVVQKKKKWDSELTPEQETFAVNNNVEVAIAIHDSSSKNLLWTYQKNKFKSIGGSNQELAKDLFRDAARRFPF